MQPIDENPNKAVLTTRYVIKNNSSVVCVIYDEDGDRQEAYFKYSDLRNNPELRWEIYAMIGEDPNQSYYELALKHDFDLARLYEH